MAMNNKEILIQGLATLGQPLTSNQHQQLLDYVALLQKWNKTYSITAITAADKMISYHVLDSLTLLPRLAGAATQKLLDVGSGGGMPGIPLAIARPDLAITLLDSNQKKTSFLRQAILELGLKNVTVETCRVEHCTALAHFDVITSRAFASLNDFVSLTRHLLAKEGCYWAMKGLYPTEELAELPADVQMTKLLAVQSPNVEGERHLIQLRIVP
jgi:16S rRNA (guanine527-N7)-methyltransferase